jgi:hypothetical protein
MNGSRPSSIVTSTSLCAEEAYWAKKNTCGIEPPPYSHPKALSRDGKTITAEEGDRKLSNTSKGHRATIPEEGDLFSTVNAMFADTSKLLNS